MRKRFIFPRNETQIECNVINKESLEFQIQLQEMKAFEIAFLKSFGSKASNCNLIPKSIFHRDLLMIFVCAHFSSQRSTRTISSVFIVIPFFLIFRCSRKWVSDVMENFLFHEASWKPFRLRRRNSIYLFSRKKAQRTKTRALQWLMKKSFFLDFIIGIFKHQNSPLQFL